MTRARIIAVVGASGGVGASCFAAALAARAAREAGPPTVCVDGHPLGGGLDVVLGVDDERGVRWPDLARARGGIDGLGLLGELPHAGGVGVVSYDRGVPCEIAPEGAAAVVRGLAEHAGLLVLDAPAPGRGGCPELLDLADDAVLLCGSDPPALAAAAVVARAVEGMGDRWWVAQRTRRGTDDVAAVVSSALELPLLGVVPDDPRVEVDLRRGHVPGARGRGRFGVAAQEALDVLRLQSLRAWGPA